VERQQFRSLVGSIDEQIIIQHNARELALLAKPIFDFVLLRDTPPDVAIPLKPILIFFEDKKMDILRNYIESICRVRDKADLTLDELTTLVEDLYLGHKEESVGVAPQTQIPSPAANEQVPDGASPEEQPKEPEPLLTGPFHNPPFNGISQRSESRPHLRHERRNRRSPDRRRIMPSAAGIFPSLSRSPDSIVRPSLRGTRPI